MLSRPSSKMVSGDDYNSPPPIRFELPSIDGRIVALILDLESIKPGIQAS